MKDSKRLRVLINGVCSVCGNPPVLVEDYGLLCVRCGIWIDEEQKTLDYGLESFASSTSDKIPTRKW